MTKLRRKKQLQRFLNRYFRKEDHGKFLTSKHPMLGRRPVDMLNSDEDFKILMDMIRGIETGSFL